MSIFIHDNENFIAYRPDMADGKISVHVWWQTANSWGAK